MQKRALDTYSSTPARYFLNDFYLGERISDLSYYEKYLKLLNCRIENNNLIYAEDYKIDGYNALIELHGEIVHQLPENIKELLNDLEETFKNAKKKIS